jgi:hypothetical protein
VGFLYEHAHATDDATGNLVNVDVNNPSAGAEERQTIDARVMTANLHRAYPAKPQHHHRSYTPSGCSHTVAITLRSSSALRGPAPAPAPA